MIMGTQSIVDFAISRVVGLRGVGGEEGILATALNMHFRCKGPEGWHFVQRSRPLATGAAAHKQAAMRNGRTPIHIAILGRLIGHGRVERAPVAVCQKLAEAIKDGTAFSRRR